MKKKALLYISSYKFTKIDNHKHEFNMLKSKYKIEVIIHDLSSILSKRIGRVFLNKAYEKNYYKFNSLNEWKSSFNKLNRKYDLTIYNNASRYGIQSVLVHSFINKSDLPVIVSPSPQVDDIQLKKNKNFYFYRLNKLLTNPFLVYYYLKIQFVTFLNSLIVFKHLYVLQSGTFNKYVTLNAKKKTIVDFHARDFSNFLTIKKISNKKKFIMFIDNAGPYFPDDQSMIGKKLNFNHKIWYLEIKNFLHYIQRKFKLKVIVIPHPKNRDLINPYFNEKHGLAFDRSNNATEKLIKNSKFIVSYNSHSSAVNYAIAESIPFIYTYSNEVKKDLRLYELCRATAKIMGNKAFKINKDNKKFKLNKVNFKKYDEYKYKFLTSKKINNIPNYKILGKIIFNKLNKET